MRRSLLPLCLLIGVVARGGHAQQSADGSGGTPPSAPVRTVTLVGYGDSKARAAAAERVSVEAVRAPIALPLTDSSASDILHLQILLDAARYGPGIIDGRWSENTLFAMRAFRESQRLPDRDTVDAEVLRRLVAATGRRDPLTRYRITAADVRGPYRALPRSVYAQAHLDCMCYRSIIEMLGERFHTSAEVLRRLNPDVDLARLAAGTTLLVPNVARAPLPAPLARVEIDRGEGSVRGWSAKGKLLFWLPSTVGSPELPSPHGPLAVQSIERDPRYHYDPRVLRDVPASRPDAVLAPGPNSPVGVLWAQLSRPHVGIHGAPDPELVGYAQSHGCVRLTNWDARWIAGLLRPGMPAVFR
jgi:lipoprotein-anchoring transpeptidase ErfK/SrfK